MTFLRPELCKLRAHALESLQEFRGLGGSGLGAGRGRVIRW